ncbi:MAG: Methyltransferase type 12 [Parcubacteria group bacterium GW2011_GWC2_39_14]|nr:MAG: Methyltransferase type 12 [Parcubacteria group bacterium GW2011_GWC2_39_14]KKR55263.1 MAG: Methyltransferase type 12 [Parcubacteria group bacterium GW2011_GWA2_40_23]
MISLFFSVFLAAIIVILFIFWLIFMVDSVTRGHDLPTGRNQRKEIFKIISEQKTAQTFYDLGCAHGALAVRIKGKFPALSVYAIDMGSVRIFFAKIRAFVLRKKVNFICADIFNVDLSQADIVYTYLWYDIMPALEKKLQKELKPGAIVVTNTSSFLNWKPIKEIAPPDKASQKVNIETLFVYRKE